MLRIHRFTTTSAVAIALCAASPAAAQALISPDAIDAGVASKPQVVQKQDQRSPDAATPFESTIDKRSPDVRYGQPNGAPVPTVTLAPTRVRVVEVPSSGFEWGDAGIGAAGMLALVLVGVGVGMAGLHRRTRGLKATTR
jgi:hypothetical protein